MATFPARPRMIPRSGTSATSVAEASLVPSTSSLTCPPTTRFDPSRTLAPTPTVDVASPAYTTSNVTDKVSIPMVPLLMRSDKACRLQSFELRVESPIQSIRVVSNPLAGTLINRGCLAHLLRKPTLNTHFRLQCKGPPLPSLPLPTSTSPPKRSAAALRH